MDRRFFLTLIFLFLATTALSPGPDLDAADTSSALSPYWGSTITQWEDLIPHYAGQRGLDPDLVAAIIFEESLGLARRVSTAGAVGLMQVMPYEAGFTWRPKINELLNPRVNLHWGTRTFSQIMRQAEGDVSSALKAYNGGWEQVDLRAPRIYSSKVLDHYARSITARAGYDGRALKAWTLVFETHMSIGVTRIDVLKSDGTITIDANFDLSRLPASTPHSTVYSFIDADGIAWLVEAWAIVEPLEGLAPNPGRGVY